MCLERDTDRDKDRDTDMDMALWSFESQMILFR